MSAQSRSQIIQSRPIGSGLDSFRNTFSSICEDVGIQISSQMLDQRGDEETQNLLVALISALQTSPASRHLPSCRGGKNLLDDLSKLITAVNADDFDAERLAPLLQAVLRKEPDEVIWNKVYAAVAASTPPPRPASSIQQTPWLRSTGSFANSTEHRKYFDDVLKEELGHMYVGVPGFFDAFFGEIADLGPAAQAVFDKCKEGDTPLYQEESGWQGWPEGAREGDVLSWLAPLTEQLLDFAEEHRPGPRVRRRTVARPHQPLQGSTADRKLDIGFVDDESADINSKHHWSRILVLGELKSNALADKASKAWLDLGRYAREVLAAQDSRRFVLGFTLCGSLMRLWSFDRLGGIASEQFDINEDGLQFVSAVLGFLWMSEAQLGFDPTIITAGDKRYIEIERDGSKERLVIDRVIKRVACVAGRATTCWRVHREDKPNTPLVVKDSWQYPEREEEGELLREATERDVVNVARYFHHETRSVLVVKTTISAQIKRTCSSSPTNPAIANRVHRRVIVCDYGKPIYKASSRTSLLAALEGCIEGYESLHTQAGLLQRDISPNNLLVNEDEDNPSWPAFLIDLDLAIKEQREQASGARGKTGTRAFMAIGVLLDDEQHSFMHDLESFFWVLFWICIHYDGQQERTVPRFDKWNYLDAEELAGSKKGVVDDERDFLKTARTNFTPYYQPLVSYVNRFRRKVFPNGERWRDPSPQLYLDMKGILRAAQNELEESEG
ncbi:hypothetical protein N0V95_009496 [Ascochyta clinopodiicola]|nr:hypothetical protein N0V95_009496 [Ascochyta clinopodiicola]